MLESLMHAIPSFAVAGCTVPDFYFYLKAIRRNRGIADQLFGKKTNRLHAKLWLIQKHSHLFLSGHSAYLW